MLLGNRTNISQPWMSYGGIRTGPVTVLQQARQQVNNAAVGLLGPGLGNLVGALASDYLVGRDFTKTGTLQNRLSGLLAPGAGTYANAFQQMRQNQTMAMLTTNRQTLGRDLKQDFFRNYYALTMGKDLNDKKQAAQVQAQVDSAMANMLSVPAALQFLFDPAQNERALQGIKNTQAGYLYWQQRSNPLSALGIGGRATAGVDAAKQIGTRLTRMATDANRWILGRGKGQSFGGFGGGAVMELASILENASDVLGDPQNIKSSLDNFQKKVKATAQALAPLKDIFGQDIKAMVDMLQSTTGQNINQLTPSMIRSMSTNTVDMARYSGATIAQIASANQKLFAQTAGYGGNTFTRVGGGLTGAYYTGLIAQGNAPAGVHAAQYAGNTARAVASAQASAGVDWTAMAYGIWKKKNPQGTIDDFMQKVRQNRDKSGSMMEAVIKTAGVNSQQGLLQGLNTTEYRTALQSGRLPQLAVPEQYQMKLADSINYLKSLNTGVSEKDLNTLGVVMADRQFASDVKRLVTNANDPKAVKAFAEKFGISQGAVNLMINRGQILQPATRYAVSEQMAQFKQGQKQIRTAMAGLDAMGTGALTTLWRGLSSVGEKGGSRIEGTNLIIGNNKISQAAIATQTRLLLGTDNLVQAQKRINERLVKNFGKDTQDILGMASNQEFSKDQEFVTSIRKIAQGATGAQLRKARAYVKARRAGHIRDSVNAKSFEGRAKEVYDKALQAYNKASAKGSVSEKDAEALEQGIQRAGRLQKLSKMSHTELGLSHASEKEQLAKLIESGDAEKLAALSKSDYEAKRKTDARLKNLSYEELQGGFKSTASNYDRQADFQKQMVTVLTQLLDWLRKNKT